MTIMVRIKEDFGCETHHGQPNARHPASTMISDVRAQSPGLFRDAAGCIHKIFHVAHVQGPEVRLPLSHCLAAEGSDMKTIPFS